MSMREKIARAIFETFRDRSDIDASWEELSRAADAGARVSVKWRSDAYAEADAVLDALLEPTIGMVSEGQDAVYNGGASPGPVHIPMTTGSFSVIFQAMIRAAKEGK